MLPISIGSSFFRSKEYAKHLSKVPALYADRFFFVADRLQIYNRALLGDGMILGDKFSRFYEDKDYLQERRQWLQRLGQWEGLGWVRTASVFGIDDLTDSRASRIHRNVRILYECDAIFQADVGMWSRSYAGRQCETTADTLRQQLSVAFVLEEIAFNLRIRVMGRVQAEFYPGAYPEALPALYRNKYSATVAEIVGVATLQTFDFFTVSPTDDDKWVKVE